MLHRSSAHELWKSSPLLWSSVMCSNVCTLVLEIKVWFRLWFFFFLLLFPIRSWTWLWISYGNVNFLCEVLCLRLVVRIILGLMSCRACRDEYERITKLTKYKAWIDVVQFAFSWFYIGFFRIGYVYDVSRVFWFLCTSRSWLDFNFLCFYFYSKYFSSSQKCICALYRVFHLFRANWTPRVHEVSRDVTNSCHEISRVSFN